MVVWGYILWTPVDKILVPIAAGDSERNNVFSHQYCIYWHEGGTLLLRILFASSLSLLPSNCVNNVDVPEHVFDSYA